MEYILLHCSCDLAFRLAGFIDAWATVVHALAKMIHEQVDFKYMPTVDACALLKC